jgi:peroxiredoxin
MPEPGLRRFVLMLLIGGLALAQGCSEEPTAAGAAAKEIAPEFELPLFDGGRFRLSEHKGNAVVINFFASWCVSCGEETPVIEKTARAYSQQGVVFLAIAVDDTEAKARAFLKKTGLTIAAGLDRSGKIKDAYGIYGMPTTYFIDRAGKVNYLHAGAVSEELLRQEIGKLL